jgi:hypothetical protein
MNEPKNVDKRSKVYREYKEWKAKFDAEQSTKPEGLGDLVHDVLQSKPIAPITNAIKNLLFKDSEDCGCDERQKKLNEMFSFNKVKCFNEEEFLWLTDFLRVKRGSVDIHQRVKLYEIYNRIFGTALVNSNCPSCLLNIIRKLDAIYKTYK